MLDRVLLVALTPLALAGGTATSWLQTAWAPSLTKATPSRPVTGVPRAGLAIRRGADGMLHTVARINGVPVDMVVDTGASRTILSDDDARKVFGDVGGDRSSRIRTLNGDRDLWLRSASSVVVGSRQLGSLEAGMIDGGKVSVIGLDWLSLLGPITITPAG